MMFDVVKKEGYELVVVLGYCLYDRQKVIFDNEVSLKGEKKVKEVVVYLGESEY